MAKTILQIQALIDSQSLDARQLINLIADYLQANPGGGGTQGIDDVLAEGQALTAPRIVNTNGSGLTFDNFSSFILDEGGGVDLTITPQIFNSLAGGVGIMQINSDGSTQKITLKGFGNSTIFLLDDASQTIALTAAGGITLTNRVVNTALVADDFADDTAAGVGGIAVGGLYHTAGAVKVRLT